MTALTNKIQSARTKKRHLDILRNLDTPEVGKILDLSCGDGAFLKLVHDKNTSLELYGVDVSGEAIEKARLNNDFGIFQQTDVKILPFQDSFFDIIFCTMSLHHYQSADAVFPEINRTLKPGGSFYLTDVIPKNKFTQRVSNFVGCYEPYHFEKFYTFEDLQKLTKNYEKKREKRISLFPRIFTIEFVKI